MEKIQSRLQIEDPEIFLFCQKEEKRQKKVFDLIASENYVSSAVLEALGTVLTNKYAEGYPEARYYNGCEHVDEVESLCIDRVKKLFGCAYANVQPHSGSQANQVVYFALLKPGDSILGMSLKSGGHLTHGAKVNQSGKWFEALSYDVDPQTYRLDYDKIAEVAKSCRPKLIIAGGSAYGRVIDFKKFREIADSVGAFLMADIAHIAGLVATGLHPSPFPYAHCVTSTTHKTLRGPRGGIVLSNDSEIAKKIDMALFPGLQGGPAMNVIAAKAVSFREALEPSFLIYQKNVIANASALCSGLADAGLNILTGGTDNHLVLVNLKSVGVTGNVVADALEKASILCNKNNIPFDTENAKLTSGLRFGSPAGTTLGFSPKDFKKVADLIAEVCFACASGSAASVIDKVRSEIEGLMSSVSQCIH